MIDKITYYDGAIPFPNGVVPIEVDKLEDFKLKVWRPNSDRLRYEVMGHSVNLDQTGLKISITDYFGARIEIIYDQLSKDIGNFVWSYRYTNEITRSVPIVDMMQAARKEAHNISDTEFYFYKAYNSEYLGFVNTNGYANDISLEHHIFIVSDGIVEVISDYEPKVVYIPASN